MKNLKNLLAVLSVSILILIIGVGYASAQTSTTNYLKMRGKILDNKTADISVFQEDDGDWTEVKTYKSKKHYLLRLNPEENYYVSFISSDGLTKVMYVDGGNIGAWMMHLDIDFKTKSIKHARVFQDPSNKDYTFKVIHKDSEQILISDQPLLSSN